MRPILLAAACLWLTGCDRVAIASLSLLPNDIFGVWDGDEPDPVCVGAQTPTYSHCRIAVE
jgi:hypothetical protein